MICFKYGAIFYLFNIYVNKDRVPTWEKNPALWGQRNTRTLLQLDIIKKGIVRAYFHLIFKHFKHLLF